ncbi:protein phosphatase regulator [Saccharomycopsis crataegensis]|uniref:Protein phosphatase regulator n=1 Tax=Saccharomycopsis crataegensis TaxID=43959 RepID=A0AAV5QIU6_9ASCO|nr:protein phosphatase regulator [Saccharomycopsis crataegensis]
MSKSLENNESGVTNGDVDWIFRGKIKKNMKGATDDASIKVPKAPVIPSPNDLTSINPPATSATSSTSVQLSKENRASGSRAPAASTPSQTTTTSNTTPSDLHASTANGRLNDKFTASNNKELHSGTIPLNSGFNKSLKTRSRSSSLSSTLTRRSIDSNDARRRLSVSSETRSLSSIPQNELEKKLSGASTSSGNGLTRTSSQTSSGGSKKSLFSSISSKFGKKKANSVPPPVHPIKTELAKPAESSLESKTSVTPSAGSVTSSPATLSSAASMTSPVLKVPSPKVASQESPGLDNKKRFGSLRGKVSARISSKSVQPPAPTERVILNKNPNKVEIPIEQLTNLKMKRVTFDINSIRNDPPQQIPSRKPKKGNVLIPEDLIAETPRLSVGIANSEKKISEIETKKDYNQKQYLLALESQKRALEEAKKHAQEAHSSAIRIANEVANYKISKNGHLMPSMNQVEEDAPILFHTENVDIDKPMHHREHHFDDDKPPEADAENEDNYLSVHDVPLDMLYTRCCHLREILPIPATLKQLKGKSKPLHVLKFLNPKPTLIDILSFSDFIAIAPINTIIFDNVILTNEMIKVMLTSLSNNQSLEKLSLKNMMIDSESWKFLCKFLLKNQKLLKLDLSQTKYRSDLSPEYYRFNMNWKLFVDVLKKRGGISELILTGIDFKLEDFQELIGSGIAISTKRLGLASSNISATKCEIISQWLNKENSSCEGIDFGFNDLSNKQLSKLKVSNPKSKLLFLSLNATNLSDVKEFSVFLKNLSELPNLSYLDLSSLPNIIPSSIPYLKRYLSKFPNLKRIHLDYNYLSAKSLAAVLDILQNCRKLIHVSLIGNEVQGVGASLYSCVKGSRSIFNLDIDYDSIPELISSRIAVLLMRNMEINLHGEESIPSKGDDLQDELIFDGSLIAESAEAFLNAKTSEYEDYSNRLLKKSLVNRTKVIREEIHQTIDALFEKRNNGGLTTEEKERLLRFCLLDSALEKIVHIYFEGTEDGGPPKISRTNTTNSIMTVATVDDDNQNTFIDSHNSPSRLRGVANDENINIVTGKDIINDNFEEEYLHNLSKDLINTNETISPELNQIQSSQIQYINPQQAQIPLISQVELPHQLAIEKSTDGQEISVDTTTGRPVLFRNVSQTSINAKKQEEEEGELHRWGYFVQQQKRLYPDETSTAPALPPSLQGQQNRLQPPQSPSTKPNLQPQATQASSSSTTSATSDSRSVSLKTKGASSNSSSSTSVASGASTPTNVTPRLLSLISGEQLRKAVIKAKGIKSINELIDKVEHDSFQLHHIYKVPPPEASITENSIATSIANAVSDAQAQTQTIDQKLEDTGKQVEPESVTNGGEVLSHEVDNDDAESFHSIDSMANRVNDLSFDDEKAVDETYDKLLNDVVRVRSNK